MTVREVLQSSISKIHISFDLWTSSHGYVICGIIAHFVGLDYTARSVLIGLKRIRTTHSEENIAPIILSMLRHYEIVSKLGVFMANNVGLNDTAIAEILKIAHLDLTVNEVCDHCLGHI